MFGDPQITFKKQTGAAFTLLFGAFCAEMKEKTGSRDAAITTQVHRDYSFLHRHY